MCGIAGYVGKRELPRAAIDETLKRMGRRGPDGKGVCRHEFPDGRKVFLLHTRLAIIDLDNRAAQPLYSDGRYIVANGELYNYIELRADLKGLGHSFITTSDTEVLLHAYLEWGRGFLDRLEGMWAFAILDTVTNELIVSRDRFGEKPLYLKEEDGGVYFASEPKALASLTGSALRPNRTMVVRNLVNGYRARCKGAETFFQEVTLLPRATCRSISEAGDCEWTYWKPTLASEDLELPRDEIVAQARELLVRATEVRLRSDVPLAFCMSGGVDSNGLISIAKRCLGYDVHGFTIVNTDSRYDERDAVRESVRHLGVRHTEVGLDKSDFLQKLERLVRYHDAPVATISYYIHWTLIEEIARQGYKVAVSGSAGDELFSGYFDHHLMYLADVANDPSQYSEALETWSRHVRPLVRNPLLQDATAFQRDPTFHEHLFDGSEEYNRYLVAPFCEPFWQEQYAGSVLRNRMLNELFHEVIPVVLLEDDANAMYHSVENRSPYLDRNVFEFSQRIPTRHLVNRGYAKSILRQALDGVAAPTVTWSRVKTGFNAPIEDLLDVRSPEVRSRLSEDSPVFDYLDRDKISRLFNKTAFSNSESKFLFNFVCTKFFLEQYEG